MMWKIVSLLLLFGATSLIGVYYATSQVMVIDDLDTAIIIGPSDRIAAAPSRLHRFHVWPSDISQMNWFNAFQNNPMKSSISDASPNLADEADITMSQDHFENMIFQILSNSNWPIFCWFWLTG